MKKGRFHITTGADGARYLYLFTGQTDRAAHHAYVVLDPEPDEDGDQASVGTPDGMKVMNVDAARYLIEWLDDHMPGAAAPKTTPTGRLKHAWSRTVEGHVCTTCGVRKLPPQKEHSYAKARWITPDGLDRNWIGACPGPASPRQGNGT